ncbi:MAG TPA: hypothetical protein PLI51_05265 [bacterium]|nr:hypothetical protein [bacterium]HPQ66122.1 hypothetical protein [bacterium]
MGRWGGVLLELRKHLKFTFSGALVGVALMILVQHVFPGALNRERAAHLFEFAHPLHVFLSAIVTATLYHNYTCYRGCRIWGAAAVILVGYFGSIGIATLSDCIVPYWGELLLGFKDAHAHLGIVEMPLVINLAALAGIAVAYFSRSTHFPHAGHVLLSTAASLFHIIRAHPQAMTPIQNVGVVFFLLLAVWIPCCLSDIVFPMLFVRNGPARGGKGPGAPQER